jgi:diguanylate cyclase (GGDEF)-like protein
LIARFGGDEFALWLDGMDALTAAERADTLCQNGPAKLAELCGDSGVNLTMSIGIAARWPGRDEDVETLMTRADRIMYEVKRAGRGHWRVAHPDSV